MHKTIEQQLLEEETYLDYLQAKYRPTERQKERVEEQIEIVEILRNTIRKLQLSLVIHSNDERK